jgi:hypothetical protein
MYTHSINLIIWLKVLELKEQRCLVLTKRLTNLHNVLNTRDVGNETSEKKTMPLTGRGGL